MATVYREVADALRRRIAEGIYPVGHPLPSNAALSEEFGCAGMTLRKALEELGKEGLVVARQGSRTMVVRRPEPQETQLDRIERKLDAVLARLGA